jgi:hypothetical protein
MASYWIVVPRGNEELFDLLSMAFQGRSDFTVIVDRRAADSTASRVEGAERRGQRAELGPDEIIVAEQAVRADRASSSQRPHRAVPVIRSRPRGRAQRHSDRAARGVHAARPSASLPVSR